MEEDEVPEKPLEPVEEVHLEESRIRHTDVSENKIDDKMNDESSDMYTPTEAGAYEPDELLDRRPVPRSDVRVEIPRNPARKTRT